MLHQHRDVRNDLALGRVILWRIARRWLRTKNRNVSIKYEPVSHDASIDRTFESRELLNAAFRHIPVRYRSVIADYDVMMRTRRSNIPGAATTNLTRHEANLRHRAKQAMRQELLWLSESH